EENFAPAVTGKALPRLAAGAKRKWSGRNNESHLQHARLELASVIVARRDFERGQQCRAAVSGFDDAVDPQPGGRVANVDRGVVGRLYFRAELFEFLRVRLVTFALERLHLHFEERAGGLVAAHDCVVSRRPGEDEAGIERLAAEGVVARAVRP